MLSLTSTPFGGLNWELKMGIIGTIVIGFIAGVIAKFIMPGSNEPQGFILTTILGIVGAVVAQYIPVVNGFGNIISSVIGAIVVLAIWGVISKNKTA
jgi:uncharacterized membrane protein YeaQ/YmgE (transglycosylase-associated protein family)